MAFDSPLLQDAGDILLKNFYFTSTSALAVRSGSGFYLEIPCQPRCSGQKSWAEANTAMNDGAGEYLVPMDALLGYGPYDSRFTLNGVYRRGAKLTHIMSTTIYNDNATFISSARNRAPPTRRKLVAVVNSSMDKYSSKFGAAIKRVAGLLPVKKSKSKSKSKGSQGAQGEIPALVAVVDAAEPVQSSGEVPPLSSVSSEVKADQDEEASGEPAGAFGRLVNAFHSDDDLNADELDSDSDEPESVSVQERRWSTPRVPIAFASGRYAAFPWPSPVAVSCFNHQRLGSDCSVKSAEHAPAPSVAGSSEARPVVIQGISPGEAVEALVSSYQVSFFSRRPPSGEQGRQEIQEYMAASIKRPALKPLRMKTRARGSSSRPVSGLTQSWPECRAEIINFEAPQPMSAVFVNASEGAVGSPTWFTGDDESLSEDDDRTEVAGCSLALWGGILGRAAGNSHDQSGWPLNATELQSAPVRAVKVAHFAVPESMSATIVGSQASLDTLNERGSCLSHLDVERRAAHIAAHSRDIVTGPRGKRSSMVEWLKLIQSDGDNLSSPPSSPESSLPTTPSSLFSPLPDFGGALEHGFKADYATYDSVISRGFNAGGNLLSL
ncbi:hypothetical protein BDV93DRAFT_590628 [Ceratobasidium sp. AG-I]|nr:hypothetical protein BDV93DRAFT_590628 [Ceratobasidium sp. AG-I]